MSDVNLDFVVSNNNILFTVVPNDINITPTDIQLNLFAGGMSSVANGLSADIGNVHIYGGSNTQVLQTDGNGNLSWTSVGNANTANFANFAGYVTQSNQANITRLGTLPISNLKITGGTNGYVLQTDGTGNLSWTAQTGNGGGGNGTPGGANTQVQFNNAGNFGGNAGFTFDSTVGNLSVPGNVVANVVGNITTANLVVNGIANLGSISNVLIGNGSNGQILSTTGNGNLVWSNPVTTWSNVANITVNNLFFGLYVGSNTGLLPGNSVTINTTFQANTFTVVNTNIANGVTNTSATDNYAWVQCGDGTANLAKADASGTAWGRVPTPFTGPSLPIQAGTNIVIFKPGTNAFAYSSNDGTTWSNGNASTATYGFYTFAAYGSNTIIAGSHNSLNYNFYKSSDFGNSWSNTGNIGLQTQLAQSIAYGNGKFMTTFSGQTVAKISSDLGNTWTSVSLGNAYLWRQIVYGNGKWVSVSEYSNPSLPAVAIVSSDDGNTWTTTTLANLSWEGVAYANGYFVASATNGNIIYSNNGTSWTTVNTGLGIGGGGSISFNDKYNQLVVAPQVSASNIAVTLTPRIEIASSDGNVANAQAVPLGTYKNLGGGVGNVGAMWVRTA
jgi:hypothetical protein